MRAAALPDLVFAKNPKAANTNCELLNEETPDPRTQTGTGGANYLVGPVPHERLKAA